MRTTDIFAILLVALIANFFPARVWSDTFGSDVNTFTIDFTIIGNPGNVADESGSPRPAGSVANVYRMGKYEISEQMIDKANMLGGLGITKDSRGADKPATSVSWNEAARFVNWLNTSTGNPVAYKFALQPGDSGYSANANIQLWTPSDAGYNPNNLYRNSLAFYFLPSVDEWYKAAYYDPKKIVYYNYPIGNYYSVTPVASGTAAGTVVCQQLFLQGPADITQAGGLSPCGTMGQGGNVWEWQETDDDLVNGPTPSNRSVRGGGWISDSFYSSRSLPINGSPATEGISFGFRVASLPEPSSLFLGAFGMVVVLWRRNHRS